MFSAVPCDRKKSKSVFPPKPPALEQARAVLIDTDWNFLVPGAFSTEKNILVKRGLICPLPGLENGRKEAQQTCGKWGGGVGWLVASFFGSTEIPKVT